MILNILLVIIGVFVVSGIIFAIYWIPKRQTRKRENIKPEQMWEAENEFRKTLIQIFGGLVVIFSLLFTWLGMSQSQRNLEKGQHITRFSQAIKFLGESNSDQKIGGIYTLEQIVKESPEEYLWTVIEVLSAFVRNADVIEDDEKKPEEKKGTKGDKENPKEKKEANEKKEVVIKEKYKIKPETQIAMTVLGRIRTNKNKTYWENLGWINLFKVKLRGVNLYKADLTRAYLRSADLTGAWLTDANLTGANLKDAKLMRAKLHAANLLKAKLTGAILTDADLSDAVLTGAKNLKVEQLLKAKTLYQVKGLPPEMEKELKEKKPELFERPKKDEGALKSQRKMKYKKSLPAKFKLQAPAVVSTSASLKHQLLSLAGARGLWLELN